MATSCTQDRDDDDDDNDDDGDDDDDDDQVHSTSLLIALLGSAQTGRLTGLHEWMLAEISVPRQRAHTTIPTYAEEIMSACSLFRLNFQGKMQEVLEHSRQLVLFLYLRSAILRNQVESSKRRLGQVRRFSLNHLDRHDAQAPDVDFSPIFLACHHLGRHPVRRSNHSCPLILRFVNLSAEAEIRQLDITIL